MKVFLHGVPDTPFMWSPLLAALALQPDEVLTPALPGFGCARPSGFAATKEAYADWLTGILEDACARAGGPVDVVGHDWGALLMARVVSQRPDLIRTWVLSNALPDPLYRWH
jgi:pimeloyl-ACP methyl ester carboxylesterase